MSDALANRMYRHLFLAQVIMLIEIGPAAVALGLLALDLVGADTGAVLGAALVIKMATCIGVAPTTSAFADRVSRRTLLVMLDLVYAATVLVLPFVTEIRRVYVPILVLQSAPAGFTPTFQVIIPDALPKEANYTRVLSLSRLVYSPENLTNPALAAALLTVVSFHSPFLGTAVDFVALTVLTASTVLPEAKQPPRRNIYERTMRDSRIYPSTPRLRGLLVLGPAVISANAMVIVDTVTLV